MGLAPGTLVTTFNPTAGASSSSQVRFLLFPPHWFVGILTAGWLYVQVVPTSGQQQLAADRLYRDANSMLYGDSKPSEDAIDRVVGKVNQECVLLLFFLSRSTQAHSFVIFLSPFVTLFSPFH